MLDINLLRENPELVREAMRVRQMDSDIVDTVLQLDQNRRALLSEVEVMKAERNNVSKEIGRMKDPAERQAKIDAMRELGDKIAALDDQVRTVDIQLQESISVIPNLPDPRTPYGVGEQDNVVLRQVGELPSYDFTPCRIGISVRSSALSISSAASKSPVRAFTS